MPETFDFPFHTLKVDYPESSTKVQFGRGYEFASKPRAPDQILYTLKFNAMVFYQNDSGSYHSTKNETINMRALEKFYERHRLFEPFFYPHEALGDLLVRFNRPLAYEILEGGRGVVMPFMLELKYQP